MTLEPITNRLLKVKHGFFTRQGGVSQGIYHSLNVGIGSNDTNFSVAKNRDLVRHNLKAKYLCTPLQTHSNKASVLEQPWNYENAPDADAIVTNVTGVAIGVLTADCGSVLFSDTEAAIIGCAHAGWQGARSGILENTVAKMVKLGAKKKNITAVVGPSIGKDSYEVGEEFYHKFIADNKNNGAFFSEYRLSYKFDLNGYIINILEKMKLGTVSSITKSKKIDTYKDEDLFFSYRRATHKKEEDYGRQISAIIL